MVVVLYRDYGRTTLWRLYSDEWMVEKGFMKPASKPYTVAELIARRGTVPLIAVRPEDKAEAAVSLLRQHAIA